MDIPFEFRRVEADGTIRVPPALLVLLGLRDGTEFAVHAERGRMILKPLRLDHPAKDEGPATTPQAGT